ncbi:uncharacterized protein VP01_2643g3, partial [Puccinia sorghi]
MRLSLLLHFSLHPKKRIVLLYKSSISPKVWFLVQYQFNQVSLLLPTEVVFIYQSFRTFEVLTDHNALKYFMSSIWFQMHYHVKTKFNPERGRPSPIITLIIDIQSNIILYLKDYSISKNQEKTYSLISPDFSRQVWVSTASSNSASSLAFTLYGFHFPNSSVVSIRCHLGCPNLFVKHVFLKHGLPDKIVNDCGSLFIQRNLSTVDHPESDGQTERFNQIIKQYLQIFICYQQDDWS